MSAGAGGANVWRDGVARAEPRARLAAGARRRADRVREDGDRMSASSATLVQRIRDELMGAEDSVCLQRAR
ncbi:MAG: hypothetical protein ACE5O2_11815, partial [Armatimonadota bacterium]